MAERVHDHRYQAAIGVLRATRRERGLSQLDLGRQLGSRQQFVSKYESGERRLDFIEFIDVATALGLDWAAVLAKANGTPAQSKG